MEYCAAGSIADIMCVLKRPLDEEQIAVVCKFTLKGLQYLHKIKKVHRDIKAGNILLNERGRAKLGWFPLAPLPQRADDFFSGLWRGWTLE